jgi:glycosyltransferase involved in cell wall biosynthesis
MKQPEPEHFPRVLTTYAKGRHPVWMNRVTLWEEWDAEVGRTWGKDLPFWHRLKRDLLYATKLFRISSEYDVIITGCDHTGLFFALLQKALRRHRKPHVFIHWIVQLHRRPLERKLRSLVFRWIINAASCALVQTNKAAVQFSEALMVPPTKFLFVPYHATILPDHKQSASTQDYIFAGGDSNRDYPSLIGAVRGLRVQLIIAALYRHHFAGIEIPPNVQIVTVPPKEFARLMAESLFVVVPMRSGLEHSGGQQTYLNAMTMGKAVVVADDSGADDYIESGVTGFVVPAGDVAAMRRAITELSEDPEQTRDMGSRSRMAAAQFTPDRFFQNVFAICQRVCETSRAARD